MNEPAGTRMQVVKGFSDLTYNFLNEKLGPSHEIKPGCKFSSRRRHSVECHWPKWENDHWVCSYVLDENMERRHVLPLATIQLWPDGYFQLMLCDRDGKNVVREVSRLSSRDEKEEPVRAYFWDMADGPWGSRLAQHLIEQTKLLKKEAS